MPVTLEGWIWSQSVGASPGRDFDVRVSATNGENLRASPNGRVVARLEQGCLLEELERRDNWVRVRREGWMWAQSLAPVGSAAPAQPASPPSPQPASSVPATAVESGSLDRALVAAPTDLTDVADGDRRAAVDPETPVRILARSGEWVRVQIEGWVREDALRPGSPGVLMGVSGAEVRSRPDEFAGKMVQWRLQFVALQVADEVRVDIPTGARYLLTRGPRPETGFVYVVLSEDQVAAAEQLQPLADLLVVGRVRTGRSRYLGNPVLQLVDMDVREP
jgi:hypothetical protein